MRKILLFLVIVLILCFNAACSSGKYKKPSPIIGKTPAEATSPNEPNAPEESEEPDNPLPNEDTQAHEQPSEENKSDEPMYPDDPSEPTDSVDPSPDEPQEPQDPNESQEPTEPQEPNEEPYVPQIEKKTTFTLKLNSEFDTEEYWCLAKAVDVEKTEDRNSANPYDTELRVFWASSGLYIYFVSYDDYLRTADSLVYNDSIQIIAGDVFAYITPTGSGSDDDGIDLATDYYGYLDLQDEENKWGAKIHLKIDYCEYITIRINSNSSTNASALTIQITGIPLL